MRASAGQSATWALPAGPSAVSQLRRHAAAFAADAGASTDLIQTIALAVSETVTNAVLHAYGEEGGGQVRLDLAESKAPAH